MNTKILSLIYSMLVTVVLTVFLLFHYEVNSSSYISDLYKLEIAAPNKDLNTYYLKPKKINDVFLFKYATNGNYFSEKTADKLLKFENINPYLLLLTTVGNDNSQTDYKILSKNQKFILEEVPKSFTKKYYINFHLFKSFLISILFSIILFLISKRLTKKLKFSLGTGFLGLCYYAFLYCFIFWY